MAYLEPTTTASGIPIIMDPANDACYISRYVLDQLEREARASHVSPVLVRGLEETAASWQRVARKYKREREDGRVIARIFALGAFGLGIALALAANPPS